LPIKILPHFLPPFLLSPYFKPLLPLSRKILYRTQDQLRASQKS